MIILQGYEWVEVTSIEDQCNHRRVFVKGRSANVEGIEVSDMINEAPGTFVSFNGMGNVVKMEWSE